jgi:uncharacterized phiE125 gp8 family phage protein
MSAQWQVSVAPTSEPVSLTEAKQHAKITQTNDDATLRRYIQTARETAEDYMGRGLYTQTMVCNLDEFDDLIWLPRAAPLQSVTTVKYYDTAGVQQTLSATYYTVDTVSRPGRIVRAANQSWPALQLPRYAGRIEITYVVGFSTVAAIPERIKQGIRMYITHLDGDREGAGEIPAGVKACWQDKVEWIEPQCWNDR